MSLPTGSMYIEDASNNFMAVYRTLNGKEIKIAKKLSFGCSASKAEQYCFIEHGYFKALKAIQLLRGFTVEQSEDFLQVCLNKSNEEQRKVLRRIIMEIEGTQEQKQVAKEVKQSNINKGRPVIGFNVRINIKD